MIPANMFHSTNTLECTLTGRCTPRERVWWTWS